MTGQEWYKHFVDSIDIGNDKKADTPFQWVKDQLKKDLLFLWSQVENNKISIEEYNKYAQAAKVLLEKHSWSVEQLRILYERKKAEIRDITQWKLDSLSEEDTKWQKLRRITLSKTASNDEIVVKINGEYRQLTLLEVETEYFSKRDISTINSDVLYQYLTKLSKRWAINYRSLKVSLWKQLFQELRWLWLENPNLQDPKAALGKFNIDWPKNVKAQIMQAFSESFEHELKKNKLIFINNVLALWSNQKKPSAAQFEKQKKEIEAFINKPEKVSDPSELISYIQKLVGKVSWVDINKIFTEHENFRDARMQARDHSESKVNVTFSSILPEELKKDKKLLKIVGDITNYTIHDFENKKTDPKIILTAKEIIVYIKKSKNYNDFIEKNNDLKTFIDQLEDIIGRHRFGVVKKDPKLITAYQAQLAWKKTKADVQRIEFVTFAREDARLWLSVAKESWDEKKIKLAEEKLKTQEKIYEKTLKTIENEATARPKTPEEKQSEETSPKKEHSPLRNETKETAYKDKEWVSVHLKEDAGHCLVQYGPLECTIPGDKKHAGGTLQSLKILHREGFDFLGKYTFDVFKIINNHSRDKVHAEFFNLTDGLESTKKRENKDGNKEMLVLKRIKAYLLGIDVKPGSDGQLDNLIQVKLQGKNLTEYLGNNQWEKIWSFFKNGVLDMLWFEGYIKKIPEEIFK